MSVVVSPEFEALLKSRLTGNYGSLFSFEGIEEVEEIGDYFHVTVRIKLGGLLSLTPVIPIRADVVRRMIGNRQLPGAPRAAQSVNLLPTISVKRK